MDELVLETTAERLQFVLRKIWGGSQTRMARDTGISQSAISNVITGRQQPGRHILAAVASHPLVNAAWLLTGTGTPIVGDAADEPMLPVTRALFEGPPDAHSDLLQSYFYPVPRRQFKATRYWFEIDEEHPYVSDAELKIAAGDKVLFETDRSSWPQDVRGFPCIVRVGGPKSSTLVFGRSLHAVDGTGTSADFRLYVYERSREAAEGRGLRQLLLPDEKVVTVKPRARVRQRAVAVAVGIYRCGGFSRP